MSPRYRYEQDTDGDTCAVASPEEDAVPVRRQYITQSLERINIEYLMMLNSTFRRIISSGDYVIVDNYICLFSPECIRSGKDPNTLKLDTCVLQNPELYCLSLVSKLPSIEYAPRELIALMGKNSDRANKFHYTRLFYSAMQFAHAGKYEKMKEEGINPDEFYRNLKASLPKSRSRKSSPEGQNDNGGGDPPPPHNLLVFLIKTEASIEDVG